MELPVAALLLCVPTTIAIVGFNGAAAVLGLRTSDAQGSLLTESRGLMLLLWISACTLAVIFRLAYRDWVHLFWSAQIPMVGLFLGSGVLLVPAPGSRPGRLESAVPPSRAGVLTFLAMMGTLALLPLVLQIALPEDHPSPRDTDAPLQGLVALAAWGLGGPLPAELAPTPVRSIGFLPRSLTVPMGTTLVAAWLWIAFSAVALVGRLIRTPRRRGAFYLLAPALLGLPLGNAIPDVWTSEPAVMRSYGPVLVAALLAGVVLWVLLARTRASIEPARS